MVQTISDAQALSATTAAARRAQADQFAMLQDREQQTSQQTTDAMAERSRQALEDAGRVNAIFADSGLTGNTQDRIAAQVEGRALADQTTLERNREARITQAQAEGSGIAAQTQTTIARARHPSLLGSGLQIAAYAADDYNKQHPKPTGN